MSSDVRETWWLMDCDLPERLNWARLRERADGSAEVLDCDGTVTRFPTGVEARHWLGEDEFVPYDDSLRSEYPDVSWDKISEPVAEDDGRLVPKMLVELPPPRDAHAELRVHGEPEWNLGFEVVTIHPLADDQETLDRLGMRQDECKSADLYWVANERLFFVAIASTALVGDQPFVSVRSHERGPVSLSFYVLTHRCPIASTTVKDTLRWLKQWIDANAMRFSEPPVKLATFDVLEPQSAPRFQLVLQRPNVGFDELVAFEQRIESALGRDHDVDGHDLVSGEGNVFVLTSNPWEAFNHLVAADLVTMVPGLKVAYRDLLEERYQLLWPPEETSFQIR